jgi:NAD(P)-dependent dehydrogenase (short-subunit alcohol dehydrogenase family)
VSTIILIRQRGKPTDEFKGRVAVVTGAAIGIGLATSTRFAEAGMKDVTADIQEVAEKTLSTYGKGNAVHNDAGGSGIRCHRE